MLRPRLEAVALRYGGHDAAWTIPDEPRPVVIAGPNGSGKSTLLDGILAGLFGDDRPGGRAARRAPGGGAPRVTLGLRRDGERFEIERDLATGSVIVRSPADGAVQFEGAGDPRGRTHDAARYREILVDLLGVPDRDTYTRTLFVRQGSLPETSLGEHLLRVAAGGHARVAGARRELAQAHRAVTSRPLHPGDRPGLDSGELERVQTEIEALRGRLEAARAAGDRRGPLALDRERMKDRLQRLSQEIERLEESHAALARGSAIEISARQLKDLIGKLDAVADALPAAADRLATAREARSTTLLEGGYPDDFPERLARAELRWRDLERIESGRGRWPAVAALALAAASGLLALLGAVPWPAAGAALGAVMAGVAWLALWLDRRRDRAEVRRELARILAGAPAAERMGPADREEALGRFHAQRAAQEEWTEARIALAATLRDARRLLRTARAVGVKGDPEDGAAGKADAPPRSSADRLARRIEAAVAHTRQRLVRERRELDRVGDASLRLPDGVVPTAEGVADALRDRRAERRQVEEALQQVGQELLERGTPAESMDALEAQLGSLLPRRDDLLRKAESLEAAYALLTDAYDAFREHDEERLLRLVSARAARLTDGALGPVVARTGLEEPRVRLRGRLVRPESPPLSFGERHALLLAIRLGAAEFLAGVGVYPPLILDEPFAHLDPERARLVWATLRAIARERQVIVASQDALLLDALGVRPDISLGESATEAEREGPQPRSVTAA